MNILLSLILIYFLRHTLHMISNMILHIIAFKRANFLIHIHYLYFIYIYIKFYYNHLLPKLSLTNYSYVPLPNHWNGNILLCSAKIHIHSLQFTLLISIRENKKNCICFLLIFRPSQALTF